MQRLFFKTSCLDIPLGGGGVGQCWIQCKPHSNIRNHELARYGSSHIQSSTWEAKTKLSLIKASLVVYLVSSRRLRLHNESLSKNNPNNKKKK